MSTKQMCIQQYNYCIASAMLAELIRHKSDIEMAYIRENKIVNPDGSIPTESWMIDDGDTFEAMIEATGAQIDALEIPRAEKILRQVENDLIKYALSMLPLKLSKEREILENVCFGLNGRCINFNTRKKILENVIKLDIRTVTA